MAASGSHLWANVETILMWFWPCIFVNMWK